MEAVLLGPSGRTVLESPVVSIGRAAENQLVLNNPRVSLHHAELHRVRQGYTITDLASGGGTFVNAQRLEKNVPHLLATDDMIHIGRTAFRYEVSGVVEEPPTLSAQADQGRVLEEHSPVPVEVGSNAQQEDTMLASFRAVLLSPSGQTVLESPVVSIGSATENQLVLNNPRVSLHHAELHRVRQGYTITDLASGGGTFVNAQRLEKNVPHLLATGDMIHIGRTAFRYELSRVVEEPPTLSAQADQGRVLEEHSPVRVAAFAPVEVGSNGAREREEATLPSLLSTAPTQAGRRSYLGDRPPVPTTPNRAGLRSYLGDRPPVPVAVVPASAPVSSNGVLERAGTMPASLSTQRPVLGTKNRNLLLVIFLTLLLIVIVGAFVVRGMTLAPTIPQTAVTTPGASAAPTSPSSYPLLAVSYAGTVSDLLANTKTDMFLTNIQQSQGTMQGSFQGLGLTGPFTGKVTPDGQVHFTVTISGGSMTLTFEGSIKEGRDIAGSYQVLDRQGSQSGYGLWNVSAKP